MMTTEKYFLKTLITSNNKIYSIYKKGKVRENRINRDYKPKVDEINVYQCF